MAWNLPYLKRSAEHRAAAKSNSRATARDPDQVSGLLDVYSNKACGRHQSQSLRGPWWRLSGRLAGQPACCEMVAISRRHYSVHDQVCVVFCPEFGCCFFPGCECLLFPNRFDFHCCEMVCSLLPTGPCFYLSDQAMIPVCSGYGSDDDCVKRRVVH
jgi:hypothetical protein